MSTRTSTQITKHRIIAGVLAVACAVVIFSLSHIPGRSLPGNTGFLSYIAHFSEYLVFASLFVIAFTGGKLKTWQVIVIAIMIASAYGVTDEFHQSFIPGRSPDPVDWLTDTVGASVGAILTTLVLRRIDAPER